MHKVSLDHVAELRADQESEQRRLSKERATLTEKEKRAAVERKRLKVSVCLLFSLLVSPALLWCLMCFASVVIVFGALFEAVACVLLGCECCPLLSYGV